MNIDVRFRRLQPSESLRVYAQRRIASHIGQFRGDVDSVIVRFADVNGPRGGVDKRCQVSVSGPALGASIEELNRNAYAAVDVAVKRAARAVGRRVQRSRRWK